MFKTLFLAAALLTAAAPPSRADEIGVRDFEVSGSSRPLSAVLWYPISQTGDTESSGENPAFLGTPAIRNAALDGKPHPLVVLSHGYSGSWRNLS